MKQAESRINVIEDMARRLYRNEPDTRLAEVFALCEIARQLSRLGDLYLTDLILHGALDVEPPTGWSAATAASQTFLRKAFENDDARSKSSPGT